MIDFGYSMYFLNLRTPLPLDRLFIEVDEKLRLFDEHQATTFGLYNKEKQALLDANKSSFEEVLVGVRREYEEVYNGMRDDEHAHDYARHISGMDSLYYNAQSQDESINQRSRIFTITLPSLRWRRHMRFWRVNYGVFVTTYNPAWGIRLAWSTSNKRITFNQCLITWNLWQI